MNYGTHATAVAIPTRAEIASLVANLPAAMQEPYRYNSGPRTFLTVGPGLIQISRKNPGAADAATLRAHARRIRDVDAAVRDSHENDTETMGLWESADEARGRAWQEYSVSGGEMTSDRARGKVVTWSRKSRARMKRTLDALDYSPLFEDQREPAMTTLTMPATRWEELTPNPAAFKAKLVLFKQAYRRKWGVALAGVWKMEFQRRGAPHLHILMTPPTDDLMLFRVWVATTWARVVGHPDPAERKKHENAGTGVDLVGDRYRDPRRIATYFAKHGFFAEKEYQNQMPDVWLAAIDAGAAGGQFWGYWSLEKGTASVELNEAAHDGQTADSVVVERHLRKLARSLAVKRHHGTIVQKRNKRGQLVSDVMIRVLRYDVVDNATGEIRRAKKYRVGYYSGGSGFLSVNDGRVSAVSIHRLLDARSRWDIAA